MTTNRGTIIKVPDNNPGLLWSDGVQRSFVLEGTWRSAVAPSPNQVVDIERDSAGEIRSLTAVDQQQLAKERLDQLGGAVQEHGKQAAHLARQGVSALAERLGKVALGALAVLWIAWFFLPALNFKMLGLSQSLTFWDLLGTDLTQQRVHGTSNHGLFALLGLAAIAAPAISPFLEHRRAGLLYALPLLYVVLTAAKIRWQIGSSVSQAHKAAGQMAPEMANLVAEMAASAMKTLMDAVSIGYGTYVIASASLVLATYAFKTPSQT